MYKKILVANRGVIALNIIRACKEMGITTVALYSDSDENSLHVKAADEAYFIGDSIPRHSYLDTRKIISLAKEIGADAIHPGYGFLAEDYHFAEAAGAEGISFIGPSAENIKLFTNKFLSKKHVNSLGIKTVEFSTLVRHPEPACQQAKELGFPVIMKPANGNHSRFFTVFNNKKELLEKFDIVASKIALFAGDDQIYLERYIDHAFHVEIPFIADSYGNIVMLPERDCSLQRRFQKLMAFSPANIDRNMLQEMKDNAEKIIRSVEYCGTGTVEFLVKGNDSCFLELNTSIQVEDSLTSKITGINMIKKQIELNSGLKLSIDPKNVRTGYGYVCRVNAEEWTQDFSPCSGMIHECIMPGGFGITIETAIYTSAQITTHYDPHIATIVVSSDELQAAELRLKSVLSEFTVKGVSTTLPFFRNIINSKFFAENDITTDLVESRLEGKKFRYVNDMEEIACMIAAAAFQFENKKHQIVPRYIREGNNSLWNIAGRMNILNLRKRNL